MSGYVNQSPTIKVYLPIEPVFIENYSEVSFSVFAKDYKERYGIDLHDIITLRCENSDQYSADLSKQVITYLLNDVDGVKEFDTTPVKYRDIVDNASERMLTIAIIYNRDGEAGLGFSILTPSDLINDGVLDQMIVSFWEL